MFLTFFQFGKTVKKIIVYKLVNFYKMLEVSNLGISLRVGSHGKILPVDSYRNPKKTSLFTFRDFFWVRVLRLVY